MSDYSHIPAPPAPPVADYSHIPAPPAPPVASQVALLDRPIALISHVERPHRRSRRGLVMAFGTMAVLALVFGVVIAARDGQKDTSLAAAASSTLAQKTARVEMTVTLPFGDNPTPVTVSGQIDFESKSSQFTMDFAALAGLRDSPLTGKAGSIEMITSGSTIYLKMPGMETLTGGKDAWLKFDTAAALRAEGRADLEDLFSDRGNDPTQMLEMLREQAISVTEIGREELRGVAATHSTAVFDAAALIRSSGRPVDEAELADALSQFTGPITVDVWIDDEGLVRRQVLSLPTSEGTFSYAIEMYDFGKPASITVPADAIDVTALLGTK